MNANQVRDAVDAAVWCDALEDQSIETRHLRQRLDVGNFWPTAVGDYDQRYGYGDGDYGNDGDGYGDGDGADGDGDGEGEDAGIAASAYYGGDQQNEVG